MPENPSKKLIQHCIAQVGRLANQDFFKNDLAVIEDLAISLATHADSEEHATEMVSRWKSQTRQMLHESNMQHLADITLDRGTIPRRCEGCIGTEDWIFVDVNGLSAVKRCTCARGRYLAKYDRDRRTPAPSRSSTWDELFERMPVDKDRIV